MISSLYSAHYHLGKINNLFTITVLYLDIQCVYFDIFFIIFRTMAKCICHKIYFKCTLQWHQVHLHFCATITTIHPQISFHLAQMQLFTPGIPHIPSC